MSTAILDTERLRGEVAAVPYWFHSIDLGGGIVTPGHKAPDVLREQAGYLPDVRDKTVLDIGAWDGFFSFETERRGAARVVSIDHYVWRQDLGPWAGKPPTPDAGELPGKRGYDVAHAALGSRAEAVVGDYLEYDGGPFDVVLYLGVLYHMPDPLGAMRKVAALTREVAVIETEAIAVVRCEKNALFEFFPGGERHGDPTNWWAPNQAGLVGLCEAAGFRRVEVLVSPPKRRQRSLVGRAGQRVSDVLRRLGVRGPKPAVVRYRSAVRAWK
jgi:tRNA (mo5U34)-methyltransferase